MSDPLSSLRKGRRMPFPVRGPTKKNIPYRSAVTPEYSADESKLLDEITSSVAATRLKDYQPSTDLGQARSKNAKPGISSSSSPSPRAAPSDHELMTLMMSRVGHLEQRLQYQTKEVKERDKKIRILEDKIKVLQNAREVDDVSRVGEMEKKCLLLQQHIHEMETFLSDYGMIWIGEKTDPESSTYVDGLYDDLSGSEEEAEDVSLGGGSSLWHPGNSLPVQCNFHVDYDLVVTNIQQLNELAGEGQSRIQYTTDGARLTRQDSVPLALFANGIVMFSGPFRSFNEASTQQCLQDIMDGYFPAELQKRFPDGVPFSVKDRRNVHFRDRLKEVFQGEGQTLGGQTGASRLVQGDEDLQDLNNETSDLPGPKLTMEQFLHKLPQSVIKAGKVIDIRQSLSNTIQGSTQPASVKVVETAAVKDMKNRLEQAEEDRPPSSRNLATLRIKSEKGDQTYILKMKFTDTIGDVRRYLDKERSRGSGPYQIMTTFPNKVYAEDSQTLQACGLVPNATLHLKSRN